MTATLYRGAIWTGDADRPAARSLLVEGGRVVAVDVEDPPTGTRVVDARHGAIWPGFVDAHVHPLMAGLALRGHRFAPETLPAQWWETLRRLDADVAPGEWLVVRGYSAMVVAREGITRHDLDAVVPQRPVVLVNADLHGILVNTAALAAAGLLGDSHAPLHRDAEGRPTGLLDEEAIGLVMSKLPPVSSADADEALLAAQARLHEVGVTGWHDALLGATHGGPDARGSYARLAHQGRLTARVTGSLYWDRERGLEQLPEIVAARADASGVTACSVKFLVDGIHESGTAAMLEPYSDAAGVPLGHDGGALISAEALRLAVGAVAAAGFDVHLHALGDRAVRDALDAIAAVRSARPESTMRAHIAHVTFVDSADVPRFRALDVSLGLQAVWTAPDFLDFAQYERYVGADRLARMSCLATWNDTAPRWALGSDWPVSTPAPLVALRAATRRALAGDADAGLAGEVLDLSTALRGATAGAAHASRIEGVGVLRPGAAADLVVLDVDPFAGADLADTRVLETVVGGRVVFSAR